MGTIEKLEHSVSLVCYAYNEEDLIAEFFKKAIDTVEAVVTDYEVVFIDDCSIDGTRQILENMAASRTDLDSNRR